MMISGYVFAQETKLIKMKVTIVDTNGIRSTGYLSGFSDSTINLTAAATKPGTSTLNYNYSKIGDITIKRKGSVPKGILIGALTGALIGVAAGFIEGDDKEGWIMFSAADKALIYGAAGGGIGAGAGAIAGAIVKKRFIIGGNKQKFDLMKISILDKVYGRSPNQGQ